MATRPTTRKNNADSKENKDLAPVDDARETAIAVQDSLPDFMKGHGGAGLEDIGQDDVETPRIKLLQGVSPEVEEFDTARSGNFWHALMERDLGSEIRVVPLFIDRSAILWRPRWDGGGILARSSDMEKWSPSNGQFEVKPVKGDSRSCIWKTGRTVAESGLLEWGSSVPWDPNSAPAATRMYNLVLAFPDHPDVIPGVVTLQRSSIRVARKLLGKMRVSRAPIYGTVFTLTRIKDVNPSGDEFWNYKFVSNGFVSDADQFRAYEEMHNQFKDTGLKVADEDSLQGEGEATGDGGIQDDDVNF